MAEAINREDVRFPSHGDDCAGWLLIPTGIERPPVVIMAHGLAAVKEMGIEYPARQFCQSGFAVLLFDYRFVGESGGTPRSKASPEIVQQDITSAIDFVSARGDLDETRIGLWGSSFGGGQVLEVAQKQGSGLRCVVAQVPALSPNGLYRDLPRRRRWPLRAVIAVAGLVQAVTKRVLSIPLAAPPGKLSALGHDSYEWLSEHEATTRFKNTIPIDSLLSITRSNPLAILPKLVRSKPTLFLLAREDALVPHELSRRWLSEAGVADESVSEFSGGHYDVYEKGSTQQQFCIDAALRFFNEHL